MVRSVSTKDAVYPEFVKFAICASNAARELSSSVNPVVAIAALPSTALMPPIALLIGVVLVSAFPLASTCLLCRSCERLVVLPDSASLTVPT